MNLNASERFNNTCCVCLKEGKLNMWDNKINIYEGIDYGMEEHKVYIGEFFNIYHENEEFWSKKMELSCVCYICLEKLKQSYILYHQIKLNQGKLKLLYEEYSHEQDVKDEQVEELSEYYEDVKYLNDSSDEQEDIPIECTHITSNSIETEANNLKVISKTESKLDKNFVRKEKKINSNIDRNRRGNRRGIFAPPNKNSSLIVSQFLPATKLNISLPTETEESDSGQEVCTMEYTALAVKSTNINNLLEQQPVGPTTEDTVYVCKYCPQAFTSSHFLINHVRKNHVCKFCTVAFQKCTDLYDHIRKEHQQHKCAICAKVLSSHSNLRAHIKRMHGVKLPPHVALLDYQLTNANQTDKQNLRNEKCENPSERSEYSFEADIFNEIE